MPRKPFTPRPSRLRQEVIYSPHLSHLPCPTHHTRVPQPLPLQASITTYIRQRLLDEDRLSNPIPIDIDSRDAETRVKDGLTAHLVSRLMKARTREVGLVMAEAGWESVYDAEQGPQEEKYLRKMTEKVVKLVVGDLADFAEGS